MNSNKVYFLGALVLSALCFGNPIYRLVHADELSDLLAVLDSQTELATRSKLNSDYVPGIITILHGKEIEAKGAQTVWQALGWVPGVALEQRDKIRIRGIGGESFGGSRYKVMLNGIAMNDGRNGDANYVFSLPIAQVNRIEVIRGPGSAIHGENAFSAVINVITYDDLQRMFVFGGSNQTVGAGAAHQWRLADSDVDVGLNIGFSRSDGADVLTGSDALDQEGLAEFSNAPGRANEESRSQSAVLTLKKHRFAFIAQHLATSAGDLFGINNYLPPDPDRIVNKTYSSTLQLQQGFRPTEDIKLTTRALWQRTRLSRQDLFVGPPQAFGGEGPDIVSNSNLRETKTELGIDMSWQANPEHAVNLGFSRAKRKVNQEQLFLNLDPVSFVPVAGLQEFETLVEDGQSRSISSVLLQDAFQPTPNITVTSGVRFDRYDDVGNATSPRVAVAWRPTVRDIFKMQYAHAFRPPTFIEVAGGSEGVEIDPELSESLELGYIRRQADTVFRVTGFTNTIKDQIRFVFEESRLGFVNIGRSRIKGLELDLAHKFSKKFKLEATVSLLDSKNRSTGEKLPDMADWISNLDLTYQPTPRAVASIHWRYIGKRAREPEDPRSSLSGYNELGAVLNIKGVLLPTATLRLSVSNILDRQLVDPARPFTYEQDYPRPGRAWWAQWVLEK